MSDEELDIDFGDEVDFGLAKEIKLPAEGNYEFIITEYSVKIPKNTDSKEKGRNVAVILKFEDPTSVEAEDGDGEDQDYSKAKIYDNIWVHFENPFAAKNFFEAVTGQELTSRFKIGDTSQFIGERVGAALVHEPDYKNPKLKRAKIMPQSYYAV